MFADFAAQEERERKEKIEQKTNRIFRCLEHRLRRTHWGAGLV